MLKATGSIEAEGNGYHLFATFNAHTAVGKQPAKGNYHVWGTAGGTVDWYGDVNEVIISGTHAILHGTFASGIEEDGSSPIGKPFTLEMTDGGSPAVGNDTFSSGWGSSAVFPWNLVSGNLVVHN